MGVKVRTRPSIPPAAEVVEEYDIPNVGKHYYHTGRVEDIQIPVQCSFVAEPNAFQETAREVSAWLSGSVDHKLIFSDDNDWFYRVKKVTGGDSFQRSLKVAAIFTITFVCEGFAYAKDGERPSTGFTNYYETSKPLYSLTGNAAGSLMINGKSFAVNVNQNLFIDTERMIAYRSNGDLVNSSITGDYEDMWLPHGENSISVSSGLTLSVYPRWRRRT
jgi:predicted phage tail component-like protein